MKNEKDIEPYISQLDYDQLCALYASLSSFDSTPVTINEFIDSDKYLGNYFQGNLFPYWREVLNDIYPNPFHDPYYLVNLRGCLAGDTKVILLNGTHTPIKEIVETFLTKKSDYWVMSFNINNKKYEPAKVLNAFSTGIKEIYEITLDNGEKIKCTSNHKFLSRNKKWISIDKGLKEGISLYPYYYDESTGYHCFKNPESKTYQWNARYKIVAKWKSCIQWTQHVHHKNFNKLDDTPSNLCILDEEIHLKYHAKHGARILEKWKKEIGKEEFHKLLKERQDYGRNLLWNDPNYQDSRDQHKESLRNEMLSNNSERAINMGKRAHELYPGIGTDHLIAYNKSEQGRNESRRRAEHMRELRKNKSEEEKRLIGLKQGLSATIRFKGKDSPEYKAKVEEIRKLDPTYNHSVISIKKLGYEEVYDLTIEKNHNFVLSSGIVAHNSIGRGKTSIACAGVCYDLHKLLSLSNPQKTYGLLPSTTILFALFNVTLSLTHDVVWDKLTQMWASSPYFSAMLPLLNTKSKDRPTLFPKNIDFFMGSRITHSLGKAVFGAIMSEANFEIIGDQVYETFNSLLTRMESRFIKPLSEGGGIPGKIWIDSSETDKFSVVNKIIDQYKRKPGVYVDQAPIWEVITHKDDKPIYSGNKFYVYKGSDIRQPEIIDDKHPLIEKEPENCIHVPIEYKDRFESDIGASLRDIAGSPTVSNYKFFRLKDKVSESLSVSKLFPDTFQLDFDDEQDQIMNYAIVKDYFSSPLNPHIPRSIHIDIGLKGDRLGIGASYVGGFIDRTIRDPSSFKEVTENVPRIITEWAFGIECKPGKEVPLYKVRQFLSLLSKLGYPISKITLDGFQSADMIQLLIKEGFESELLSVDRTPEPYAVLRSLMYENRWMGPKNEILKREIFELESEPDGNKIDHPTKNIDGTKGSKDISDGVSGSVFNCVNNSHKYKLLHMVEQTVVRKAHQRPLPENIMDIMWKKKA
jgi:intein/homing endonuclease